MNRQLEEIETHLELAKQSLAAAQRQRADLFERARDIAESGRGSAAEMLLYGNNKRYAIGVEQLDQEIAKYQYWIDRWTELLEFCRGADREAPKAA